MVVKMNYNPSNGAGHTLQVCPAFLLPAETMRDSKSNHTEGIHHGMDTSKADCSGKILV